VNFIIGSAKVLFYYKFNKSEPIIPGHVSHYMNKMKEPGL